MSHRESTLSRTSLTTELTLPVRPDTFVWHISCRPTPYRWRILLQILEWARCLTSASTDVGRVDLLNNLYHLFISRRGSYIFEALLHDRRSVRDFVGCGVAVLDEQRWLSCTLVVTAHCPLKPPYEEQCQHGKQHEEVHAWLLPLSSHSSTRCRTPSDHAKSCDDRDSNEASSIKAAK